MAFLGRAIFSSLLLSLAGVAIEAHSDAHQKTVFERDKVLAIHGGSEPVAIDVEQESPGPGRIFAQTAIGHAEASTVRLRIRLINPSTGNWTLRVSGPDEEWTTTADNFFEEVKWTPAIKGSQLKVVLESSVAEDAVQLKIDRKAFEVTVSAPQAVVGDTYDILPIQRYSEEIIDLGKSVAQIKFVGDDGPIYNCTGFLVTQELILTNEHCISSEQERQSAIVAFDYDSKTAAATYLEFSELVRSNAELDYSLLRLNKPLARTPLSMTSEPLLDEALLYVIQHPQGWHQHVARTDCRVEGISVLGRGETLTDFSHRCDTLGGSSGAPVLELESHAVVGLHHLGYDEESNLHLNRAVHIKQIYEDFPEKILEGKE